MVGTHRFYQTCLIIFVSEIGGEIGEKIGRFLNRKIGGVIPHRFSCPTYRFLKKNRPTTTNFSILGCLGKSVRNIVWWELGLRKMHISFAQDKTLTPNCYVGFLLLPVGQLGCNFGTCIAV